jgi:hypothetical protein
MEAVADGATGMRSKSGGCKRQLINSEGVSAVDGYVNLVT